MNLPSVVVAGHICLDILPQFDPATPFDFHKQFRPGSLTRVGPALFSTGGAVANTGLAFHRLGLPTRLVALTGDDDFGRTVRRIIDGCDPQLGQGIIPVTGETTSYSIIISPPGIDRLFLHCPGANDAFSAENVSSAALSATALMHFGYPPIMRRMYMEAGDELVRLFRRAKDAGVTTSLDLCSVDPATEPGQIDWRLILERVLPRVDVFTPSLDELLFMLDRRAFEQAIASGMRLWISDDPSRLPELGRQLIEMGVGIALIKLGDLGTALFTAEADRLAGMGRAKPMDIRAWAGQELWGPCFKVRVAGTTGAGDATIAGFLSGLLRGLGPEGSLAMANAVGAFSVEAADSSSGLPDWETVQNRVAAGWERLKPIELAGWLWKDKEGLWARMNAGRFVRS